MGCENSIGGHKCVVCDQSKNSCAHAHALEVFLHAHVQLHIASVCALGCANKDLDGSLGPLGKFIEYIL